MPRTIRQLLKLWFSDRSHLLTQDDYKMLTDWFTEVYSDN